MNKMLNKCLKWLLIFIAGAAFSFIFHGHNGRLANLSEQIRGGGGGGGGGAEYEFINPLLECELGGETVEFDELRPFKNKVVDLTSSLIKKGEARHISVYFRDLNNGPWFGINEKEVYAPGSLLKVPLMIAAFRQEEKTPGFFEKVLKFEKPLELPKGYHQDIKPRVTLELGKTYSIEELVRRSIIHSDNESTSLVSNAIAPGDLDKTHADLGIIYPNDETPEDYITIRNYASFFRILFNASYLSRDSSERALEMLSETEFQDGLAAGVPRNTKIAHKFGERGTGADKQIHDCGIIYYPDHPYLLCIMNRGSDITTLSHNIAKISGLVYQEIDKQAK